MSDLIRGFWDKLDYPAVALAPMDGVTDAAFRYIAAKHGQPAFTMTEFTNVEGLARGAVKMLVAFLYSEVERPVVAQIYGVEVDSFYKCTVTLAAMGFDGVDINMGCPANNVAKRGSGAALIRTPELAKEIIRACKKGARDWKEGITLEEAGVHEDIIETIEVVGDRVEIPISVKTRVGFDKKICSEWTKTILEEMPANISMHGRTLKQAYEGMADWEEIAKGAEVCKGSGVTYFGNGDVLTYSGALKKCADYGVDGVLIARGAMGNPWVFRKDDYVASVEERFDILLEHAHYFTELNHIWFQNIKKHLGWYCKGFPGCRELRMKLMQTHSLEDIEKVIGDFRSGNAIV